MENKINKIPVVISIVVLCIAIFPLSYGYYTLLRLIVCGTAIYTAYNAKINNKLSWTWIMCLILLLFNPLIPVKLDKETWRIIDIITACLFLVYLSKGNRIKKFIGIKKIKIFFIILILVIIFLVINSQISNDRYQREEYPIVLVKEELQYKSPAEWLKSVKGDITILGWKTQKVRYKPNTFLVKYTYVTSKNELFVEQGWWWEVNTKEKIVRRVTGDSELEKKYGLVESAKAEEQKVADAQNYRKSDYKDNWRKLQKGISSSQVINILGEPDKVNAGYWTIWYYYGKGEVEFYNEVVSGWREY